MDRMIVEIPHTFRLLIISLVVLALVVLNALYVANFRHYEGWHHSHRVRTKDYQISTEKKEIALLVSFPNSGTSYTILNVEILSNATSGTNYDGEVTEEDCCTSIFNVSENDPPLLAMDDLPSGKSRVGSPFIHYPHKQLPTTFLTKTHCSTDKTTFEEFARLCFSVVYNSSNAQNELYIPYSSQIPVTKFVHLIRSPMDNLVARKHMAARQSTAKGLITDPNLKELFLNDTNESFRQWCYEYDKVHLRSILSHKKKSKPLYDWLVSAGNASKYILFPCVSDLYRYVTWHNFAVQLTTDKAQVHLLYYEDYTADFNRTVTNLMIFLGLPIVGPAKPFQMSKTYPYYLDDELKVMKEFVRVFSTIDTWSILRRYFE